MTPRQRMAVLVVHVSSSVGWIGAAGVYLVLCVVVMTSRETDVVRVLYPVMRETTRWVLVPVSLVSLASGWLSAMGSRWGLLRHRWVAAKLAINVVCSLVLLVYTQEVGYFARRAELTPLSVADLELLRGTDGLVHAVGAMVILLVAVVLAVYKPRGLTRFGRRRLVETRSARGHKSADRVLP